MLHLFVWFHVLHGNNKLVRSVFKHTHSVEMVLFWKVRDRKCKSLQVLLPPNCLKWVCSSQGHQYRPVSLITSSVCFRSEKTSILGYSRLLKASLLSSSFFLLLSPSLKSSPRVLSSPFLLLQCNLQSCLIDGWMMKFAGGGMVVPCFLLLWWRRFQQTEILSASFSRFSILYFIYSAQVSRFSAYFTHIDVSTELFRPKIDETNHHPPPQPLHRRLEAAVHHGLTDCSLFLGSSLFWRWF